LGADLIDDLVLRGHPRPVAKDEVVFHEGDTGDHVFLVRTGQTNIRISAPSGREFLLTITSTGEHIGELAAIDSRARSATALAELGASGLIHTGRLRVDIVNRQALETLGKDIQ